ncbi:MAG: toprim domain-containing protein [Deltaproteobacteria bacterium]|jgi:hypothetical protein|nr:toprim domain-containing protein [Deltaproteobacteria bacterium]
MDNFNNGLDNHKNQVSINVHSKGHDIALNRLTLILPLLNNRLHSAEARELTRQIAKDSGLSVKTLQRYVRLYRENLFNGLIPKTTGRTGTRSISPLILEEAAKMRRAFPFRSVKNIIKILEREKMVPVGSIKRATLQDQLSKIGHSRAQLKIAARSNVPDVQRFQHIFNPSILNGYVNDNNNTVYYTIPEPCELTWDHIKNYLSFEKKIPVTIIDDLHNKSHIWSDKNLNCVFPCYYNSGAFLRGTLVSKPLKLTIGKDGEPYKISGDNIVIITEDPIDALSLKYYYNNATIISTRGKNENHKLLSYIADASEVYLTHDNNQNGNE